jgi:hypothetical protein
MSARGTFGMKVSAPDADRYVTVDIRPWRSQTLGLDTTIGRQVGGRPMRRSPGRADRRRPEDGDPCRVWETERARTPDRWQRDPSLRPQVNPARRGPTLRGSTDVDIRQPACLRSGMLSNVNDRVHQAAGMIAAQTGCGLEEALHRLIIRAEAMRQTIEDTALDVLDSVIRFDQ